MELRDRLQSALGSVYRLEKELGGGGMSRVFLAEEVELGRQVVVKVLPPELSAGVNVDRFRREIQLAARLQHPHVVPLLSAGSKDDLIWYVMPYLKGESLRAKLAREGELPVGETVRILREVADALQYAHSNQVVHRDIKPDNILISNRHAVVTDFGVAKAVSASAGDSSLTSLGVALGTPAYMAPEQAAADPHVDHRADLYGLGAMAYEMLTGRPPFTANTPQAVLAAQVTQAPDPVTLHRDTVPPALAELVMKCLLKKPADRWQRAEELIPYLDAVLTPTGGMTPTQTQPVAAVDFEARARKAHPARVAALFGLAAVGVLALVWMLVRAIGLPDWVFFGAIALLALGLPVMLLTGHHERRRAMTAASIGQHTTPVGLQRHFTFRKALLGGGAAFATLAVLAGGYAGMRAMGIGPVGTLVAKGALAARDRILLADFENATPDSTVAESVTELLRIDLAQSRVVSLLDPRAVAEVLTRMERPSDSPLTAGLAAEIAAREGLKAWIEGEVRSLGTGFVVSARIVESATGRPLVAGRETANGPGELIAAVDRLSKRLRERVGESLRTLRAAPPLEQLTTGSLEALRVYAQATRAYNQGERDRAIGLMEQTLERDSTFAMAWRRIAAILTSRGGRGDIARAREAASRAMGLRDRLSELEKLQVEAYHAYMERDWQSSVTSYLRVLDRWPDDPTALNNIALAYGNLERWERREEMLRRAITLDVAPAVSYTNLIAYRLNAGDPDEADSLLRLLLRKIPDHANAPLIASTIALARQDWAASETEARRQLDAGPAQQQAAYNRLSTLAAIHGRIAEADRHSDAARRISAERFGTPPEEVRHAASVAAANQELWLPNPDLPALARRFETLWAEQRAIAADRPVLQRGYPGFISAFARVGLPDRAQALYDEYRAALTPEDLAGPGTRYTLASLAGDIALAEGDPRQALATISAACAPFRAAFAICDADPSVAEVWDAAGEPDSALAVYERYLTLRANRQVPTWIWQPRALRRAGQLHEQKGNREKALEYYGRFVDLWQDADPMLQPMVRETRQWIAQLTGEPR